MNENDPSALVVVFATVVDPRRSSTAAPPTGSPALVSRIRPEIVTPAPGACASAGEHTKKHASSSAAQMRKLMIESLRTKFYRPLMPALRKCIFCRFMFAS
jgi:hypothetical protein